MMQFIGWTPLVLVPSEAGGHLNWIVPRLQSRKASEDWTT